MLSSAPVDHQNPSPLIEVRSLRQQVYDYLRTEMQAGNLLPGSFIKLREISERLGISKTPLRDALIKLECEGFVTILPRRGVLVNKLSIEDIRNVLEILGALEGAAIYSVFERFDSGHIAEMKKLNKAMRADIAAAVHDSYYKLNIEFHNVFLNLSPNTTLKRIIMPFKERLYDFPRRSYIEEWELINCDEHDQFIEHIERGERDQATDLMKNSHWSFEAYETFIQRFYFGSQARIEAELAWRK